MTRYKTAQVLAGVSAVGFLLAAGLHTTEYRRVVLRAQQGFAGLAPFVATLWLTFAAALVILGLIVTLVAFGRVTPGRSILALAACFPAVTVVLQLRFLGFTPPVAIFSAVAAMNFAAALTFPTVPLSADAIARLEALERGVQDLQKELAETHERLDFTERLLTKAREER